MKEIRLSFIVFILIFLTPVSLHASGVVVENVGVSSSRGIGIPNQEVDIPFAFLENTPPVITHLPSDTSIEIGQSYTGYVSATDAETPENIRYSIISPPEGMTIDAVTGTIEWTTKNVKNYNIQVIVTNGELNTFATFKIMVFSENTPPVITYLPQDTTIEAWQFYTDKVTAEDNTPTPDGITYSLMNPPNGMSIDAGNGTIEWIPADVGDYTITVCVTDGDKKTEKTYTITVVLKNESPVITHFPNDT
ncbi:MAG: putative Ig domain-containing protein, partial [Candidatus Helarchaeota archaeon]|nr:putative Ig domain-containing protein [Candidatus Helarchaeota archaeon]